MDCVKMCEFLDRAILERDERIRHKLTQVFANLIFPKYLNNRSTEDVELSLGEFAQLVQDDPDLLREARLIYAVMTATPPKRTISANTARYIRRLAGSRGVSLPVIVENLTYEEAKKWIHDLKSMPKKEEKIELTEELKKKIEERLW